MPSNISMPWTSVPDAMNAAMNEPVNEPGRWSTSAGELSFALPAGWSAVEARASDGVTVQLRTPGGTEQATLVAGRLAPNEAGQPIQVLASLALPMLQASFPHLSAEPIAYSSFGNLEQAASVLFSGAHPMTGQPVRLWCALGILDAAYLKIFFEAVVTPQYEARFRELQQLLASLRVSPPRRDARAEASIVGKWRRQYEGQYGVYVDVYTFSPDGRWHLGENSDFFFPGSQSGWQTDPGGFGGESGKGGTWQIIGDQLVLQGPSGVEGHSIQVGPEALVMDGNPYQRIA